MGEEAKRHTRARSKVLGHNSRVTKSICKMLVSPSKNPVRKQPLEAQIAYHKIPVQKRQLQRKLKEHTKKAHVDPNAQSQGRVLREQGTRDRPENIEERPPLKGVRFHIAAWISWWGKAEKLRFYNDEEDKIEQPPMPPKPRRRPTTETEEEYKHRLKEWEASKPHAREVKIQEDGDPSHGMRKAGLAEEYKRAYNIKNHRHPAQSPDLNPIEGIWAIIKQRLRKRIFDSEEEMKQALQEEWDKITMAEIRHRICDMPRRCAELVRSEGGPIRGNKW
ncbi:Transposable element Tc3 transposase protein [Rutstroemia sp. NJR-2017a BBW]|nr:Transposable element Tc3 transposase protein [Rutstroemia sp. NJR-2017a BBW]